MEPFPHLDAAMLPVARANVDTDQVVPARYLQKPRSDDFGQFLFRDLRFDKEGRENPEFVLNQQAYRQARIVVAQENFGCGSSREHAVWALHDYGFRAVIAPSFGDIFFSNALKNGLLPVVLPAQAVARLLEMAQAKPGARAIVDLPAQTVTAPDGATHSFDIDAFSKKCLIEGLNELDYTLQKADQIAAFEQRYAATHP
ncbi:3-isopropylmalate dehydratase small subunit [Pollutimonas sp. M17]|uniref:3-isopropylmalate dehydratase small subunit n=1 Tax=Pollutimonas sp. M17 TaxID=2962065 RepID=UPI0021F4BB6D|nr:3-isopropylmalate dehydratase small subunit [Pollutimonas sp. M17]UYO95049.1 3-isopropylmalate dehydratase small subunit [Pollutimonas sp. M17]